MARGRNKKQKKQSDAIPRPPVRKPFKWKGPATLLGVMAFFVAMYLVRPDSGMHHGPAGPSPIDLVPPSKVPERYEAGMRKFQENCIQCHGDWAQGTNQGPPLVHDFYKPSHHADFAFYKATQVGVRAHHWPFGDMPPISGINRKDMDEIIPFLRWWQRENGVT